MDFSYLINNWEEPMRVEFLSKVGFDTVIGALREAEEGGIVDTNKVIIKFCYHKSTIIINGEEAALNTKVVEFRYGDCLDLLKYFNDKEVVNAYEVNKNEESGN